MKKLLIPILSLILGAGGGAGAAIYLADPSKEQVEDGHTKNDTDAQADNKADPGEARDIVKLTNQFVVPVLERKRVSAVVILTLALEAEASDADRIRTLEPKLRDTFLAELFNLASLGGFKDPIISQPTLELIKKALSERARDVLGDQYIEVLITDMARQDTR